jgi:hypothetical protein
VFALLAVAEVRTGGDGGCVSVGDDTTAVTVAVLTPALLDADKVYVVVREGNTVMELRPVTSPTLPSIRIDVAPVTVQESETG